MVAQIYFGVRQACLLGLVERTIRQKTGAGRQDNEAMCDAYGENPIKAILLGSDWTYHHDEVNLQMHMIAKKSGMTSDMEVDD